MNILHFIKRKSGYIPELYLFLARMKGMYGLKNEILGKFLVTKNTDIVIEGYPRSANTYAVVAFQLSQSKAYDIAHHYHAAGQIVKGVRLGKPVIVLVRNPQDAIASLCIRHEDISIERAIDDYLAFYEPLIAFKNKFVTADFSIVQEDFSKIIERVNHQYQKNFVVRQVDAEFEKKCFDRIDEISKAKSGGVVAEMNVARPSENRSGLKNKLIEEINGSSYKVKMNKADVVYKKMLEPHE